MPYPVIGVMGPGETASEHAIQQAYQLGMLIARQGWVLLSGGRNAGVMDAVSRGAKSADGLVVGILPHGDRSQMSAAVDIAIVTDLGNARNNINVLSSDVVIAFEGGLGTLSEVALALKAEKPVILLDWSDQGRSYLRAIAPNLRIAADPDEAIAIVADLLDSVSSDS